MIDYSNGPHCANHHDIRWLLTGGHCVFCCYPDCCLAAKATVRKPWPIIRNLLRWAKKQGAT